MNIDRITKPDTIINWTDDESVSLAEFMTTVNKITSTMTQEQFAECRVVFGEGESDYDGYSSRSSFRITYNRQETDAEYETRTGPYRERMRVEALAVEALKARIAERDASPALYNPGMWGILPPSAPTPAPSPWSPIPLNRFEEAERDAFLKLHTKWGHLIPKEVVV